MGLISKYFERQYKNAKKGTEEKMAKNKIKDEEAKKKPLTPTQVKGRAMYEKFIRGE